MAPKRRAAEARELEEKIAQGGLEQANNVGRLVKMLGQVVTQGADGASRRAESEAAESGSEWSDEEGEEAKRDGAVPRDKAEVQDDLAVLHVLRRCFTLLLERGDLKEANKGEDAGKALTTYTSWLERKYVEFLKATAGLLDSTLPTFQVAALRTLMHFVQHDSKRREVGSAWGGPAFRVLVSGVVTGASAGHLNGQVLRVLGEEFLDSYADVAMYALLEVEFCCLKLSELDAANQAVKQRKRPRRAGPAAAAALSGEAADGVTAMVDEWAVERLSKCDGDLVRTNLLNLLYASPCETSKERLKDNQAWWVDPGNQEEGKSVRSPKAHKRAFQDAWLAFMGTPGLAKRTYRTILLALPKRVIPNLTNPLLLSDFLSDAYAVGGVTSVMALSSLFMLITEHGLDCPDFYGKLYSLLSLEAFHAKHRAQFFELLDKVLSSAHLATYLVAAFAKRISRIALLSPPGAAMYAVVLVSNLLKKHPTCLSLVHKRTALEIKAEKSAPRPEAEPVPESEDINASKRSKLDAIKSASLALALGGKRKRDADQVADANSGVAAGEAVAAAAVVVDDPFRMEEDDPAKAAAVDSCLWEIEALTSHYSPNVSLLVRSLFHHELKQTLETKKVQPPAPVGEFLAVTYRSLFDKEVKRGRKKAKGGKAVPLSFSNPFASEGLALRGFAM